ncbi:hypothetical protein PhCBS80983_g05075 [Powellomyces hirtus]|uniref:Cytochrome P450 n=1 Tax=Powellomyces hirtus TaxID=109895 RepID=A0A507DW34_9FUNG|nr:hypothetical protein PhCBS80983_g05075 [Powellomyces hirtus]
MSIPAFIASLAPDSTVVLACSAVAVAVLVHYRGHAVGSSKPTAPSPNALPLIGNAYSVIKNFDDMLDNQVELMKATSNKTYALTIPFVPTIYVTQDPINVEFVLRTQFENFVKGERFHEVTKDVLGEKGIFNSDGEVWRVQRKLASRIFTVKNFKDFVGRVFREEAEVLLHSLDAIAEKGDVIDLQDIFFRFTLDSFGKIGFNADLNCLGNPDPVPFAQAFDSAQTTLHYRFFSSTWKLEEYLFPSQRNMTQNVHTVRSFARKIVSARRSDPNAHTYDDLLSLFMREDTTADSPDDDEHLVDVVLNFIIAGRDTTAQALSWTIWLLSRNPHAERALLEEIDAVLDADSDLPSYDQIKLMKYAKAVFSEALRLYPSVPREAKFAVKDITLPDGTFVPAGSTVSWLPYVMGRCTDIWGEDAAAFKPERWLAMETLPSPYVYPAFNGGPRLCLGKSMAELEGVFVLVVLVKRFKVTVVRPDTVKPGNSLTLPIKDGLSVKIERR